MIWTAWGLLAVGLVLLVVGAELLVRGAARLAVQMGLSPLVIGLTIVAFGTSAPELAVSLESVFSEQATISLGNVIGSNIFNVLAILGLSSAISPLFVSQQLIRLDVPLMIGVTVLAIFFGLDGTLGRSDGFVLFAGAIAYTGFLLRQGRDDGAEEAAEYVQPDGEPVVGQRWQWAIDLAYLLVGLVLLVAGSKLLVSSSTTIARAWGASELIVGLTVVAVGTSLPEMATSLVASLRGERDIAVGNVVGSNIFNILAVLGLASALAPGGIPVPPAVLRFDLPVALAVAVACMPVFFSDNTISRWEGALFVSYYVAYTSYLIFAATSHALLPMFSATLLYFVVPITAITLFVIGFQAWRSRRKQRQALRKSQD